MLFFKIKTINDYSKNDFINDFYKIISEIQKENKKEFFTLDYLNKIDVFEFKNNHNITFFVIEDVNISKYIFDSEYYNLNTKFKNFPNLILIAYFQEETLGLPPFITYNDLSGDLNGDIINIDVCKDSYVDHYYHFPDNPSNQFIMTNEVFNNDKHRYHREIWPQRWLYFLQFDIYKYNNLIIDKIIDDDDLNKDLKNNLKKYIINSIRDVFTFNEMYLVYNSDEDFNKTFKEDSKPYKPINIYI